MAGSSLGSVQFCLALEKNDLLSMLFIVNYASHTFVTVFADI
jgi:hypothetical protein